MILNLNTLLPFLYFETKTNNRYELHYEGYNHLNFNLSEIVGRKDILDDIWAGNRTNAFLRFFHAKELC